MEVADYNKKPLLDYFGPKGIFNGVY